MSAMGDLASELVEFGGQWHTHDGWIARRADGSTEENGYRYARQVPCEGCDDSECPGWYWQYAGPAFASEDAALILAVITRPAGCVCAHYRDGSVYTSRCPLHADTDPCLTMSWITGRRRTGTIRRGICTACGHNSRPGVTR